MRLELALIVGILFFCSWCAYIVARMSASVSPGSEQAAPIQPTAPRTSTALSHHPNWTSPALVNQQQDYQRLATQARQQQPQVDQNRGQTRPFDATSETSLARLQAPQVSWPPPVQQQQQVVQAHYVSNVPVNYYHQQAQPPLPAAQWQAYALPTNLAPASELQDNQGEEEQQPQGLQAELPEYEDGNEEEEAPATAAASDYAMQPEEVEAPSELNDGQTGDGGGEEEEETGDDLEGDTGHTFNADGRAPGSELDEVAQRRSFSELESASKERDKNGNLLVTRRRHLINGKPVQPRRRRRPRNQLASGDVNQAAESARDDDLRALDGRPDEGEPGASQEADFERIAAEIDQEDKLRRQNGVLPTAALSRRNDEVEAPIGGGQLISSQISGGRAPRSSGERAAQLEQRHGHLPAGSGRVSVLSGQSGPAERGKKRNQKKTKKKRGGDNKHEHRLSETLTQQQWDDDAASSSSERPAGTEEEAAARVSDIVEQDEEARKLEQMAHDLALSPDFGELQRRRRRSVAAAVGEQEAEEEEPDEAANEVEMPARVGLDEGRDYGGQEEQEVLFDDVDEREDQTKLAKTRIDKRQQQQQRPFGLGKAPQATQSIGASLAPAQSGQANDGQGETQTPWPLSELQADKLGVPHANQWANLTANNNESSGPMDVRRHLLQGVELDLDPVLRGGARQTVGEMIKSSIGAARANSTSPTSAHEIVSGQEDMQVEILAQPPAAFNHSIPVQSQMAPPFMPPPLQQQQQQPQAQLPPGLGHFPRVASPFASGSSKVAKKKKGRKFVKKRSKLVEAKFKAAKAYANKQRSKQKRGQMRKKKRKSERRLVAGKRHFAGATHGHKQARGQGVQGARKGATYFKDKGYKKKGFKKAYHKLETGDHKTYFDEFRDKDHNRKWKNYDDKHKYSQKKKWAGHDLKHMRHHDLKEARGKASKSGKWSERALSEHTRKANKFKRAKKQAAKSVSMEKAIKKKKKRKRKKKVAAAAA